MGNMQATSENRLAGRWLEAVRGEQLQGTFARALSQHLGVHISPSALSSYESGRRQVPSAVMIAASKLTRQPMIVDEESEADFVERIAQRLEERARARG